MKKIFSIFLAAAMLLPSLLISPTAAEEKQISYPFEVSDFTDLSSTGVRPGANSAHGNHQIRTVHTSHGDYAAYITNSYEVDDGVMDQWSLFRIDAESGKAEVIFTGEKYQPMMHSEQIMVPFLIVAPAPTHVWSPILTCPHTCAPTATCT